MSRTERMVAAYLETAEFADFGGASEVPEGAKFSPLAIAEAHRVCANFLHANSDLLADSNTRLAGANLWFTRNGHGTGFWDTPSTWGEREADIFTRCAHSLGHVDMYLGDDGLVYFS